jgi:hypothetical protein
VRFRPLFERLTVPIVYASNQSEPSDAERRSSVFDGDFFVYGPRPTTMALRDFARDSIEQMLGAEPSWAQQRMTETEFSVLFKVALRNFSRRQAVMSLMASIVSDFGCDPSTTYMSCPELTAITGQGFLAQGIGGPRHPHRDTWYAASPSQLHWWISLYDHDGTSSVAFHPRYWDWPVANSSVDFDYQKWQDGEFTPEAGPGTGLSHPRPLEAVVLSPEIRIASPAGGLIIFSSAQLYSIVPNDSLHTYFATHFQTVNERDLLEGAGALNLDAEPHGSSLSSFLRCDDLSPISPEIIERAALQGARPSPE